VVGKALGDELRAAQPARLLLRHHLVHLDDPSRQEGDGERQGARAASQAAGIVQVETVSTTVGVPAISECSIWR
jgi:hypothetical protein